MMSAWYMGRVIRTQFGDTGSVAPSELVRAQCLHNRHTAVISRYTHIYTTYLDVYREREHGCRTDSVAGRPISGAWTVWTAWSVCEPRARPAECGADGRQTRHRTCTQPLPVYNGPYCVGATVQKAACAIEVACANGWCSVYMMCTCVHCSVDVHYNTARRHTE